MDEKFLFAYQNFKFKENESDCFSKAATKRITMMLNFFGSIYMKESNHVTEFLLNEDLMEYGKIVDDRNHGNVNNYVDYALSLLSNYQNDDLKYWNSKLDEFEISDFLEPLPCSNDVNCKNAEFTSQELNELKLALNQYDELEETEDLKVHSSSKVNASLEKEATENIFSDKINKKKFIQSQTLNFHVQESPKSKECSGFRTARDEFRIQNLKKLGKNTNSAISNKGLNNSIVKKTLGTRKGGIYGKFQPPIKTNDTEENEQTIRMETDEMDDRLKNIDPAMVELIKNEIMVCGSKITWDDIAGLTLAKNTIQEIVVWPMLRPDIFTGLRRPPKGILLFGPPGTGKTLIGKCIASQSNSTFFSISASSLTSKWVGDGEKMVRTLFAVAKVYQPAVVFIDEIDSLLSQRSDSEHECSRRIKTEFLVQLDGAGTGEEDRILIIGATNRPQELDEAARRRLVKRLYIPLPDENARRQIIENLIASEHHSLNETEIESIAKLTKGYSGADVKNLCQEASLGPIRSIPPLMIQSINPKDVRPLNFKDFESALCRIKSSVSESDLDVYLTWDKQYGCGSVS